MHIPFFQKILFYGIEGYWPNTDAPRHIKEVVFKNRINDQCEFINHINKYKVKVIIDEINKKESLNIKYAETLGCFLFPKDISFESLTAPCFIKATHGCGMNLFFIPNETDVNMVLKETNKWLGIDYYKAFGEMNYFGVEKNILIEASMFTDNEEGEVLDIKVHCLFGFPIAIQFLMLVNDVLERKTYNTAWQEQKWFENECLDINIDILPKSEILKYARVLSQGFDYVRVDFSLVNATLYFCEFTFTPAGGYMPLLSQKVDEELFSLYLDEINNDC